MAHVRLDRVRRDDQAIGDLTIAQAFGDEQQHFAFARADRRRFGAFIDEIDQLRRQRCHAGATQHRHQRGALVEKHPTKPQVPRCNAERGLVDARSRSQSTQDQRLQRRDTDRIPFVSDVSARCSKRSSKSSASSALRG
jgi:hypothetical protein